MPSKVDTDAIRDLLLYIENDRRFSLTSPEGIGRFVRIGLLAKKALGKYDSKRAARSFEILVRDASKAYVDNYGTVDPAVRRAVAAELAKDFETRADLGEL